MLSTQAMLPKDSGDFIVQHAKYVKVLSAGIENLKNEIVAGILDKRIDIKNFTQSTVHPRATDRHALEWIFVADTLNFCFWTPSNTPKYRVEGYTGYFALCAALNRAVGEGKDITSAEFYATIDDKTLLHIFRADDHKTKIPLFEKRVECLREVGTILLEKWSGKFGNLVNAAERSAAHLLRLIVEEFPCFRDEADYEGERVGIYKRAQILIGDVWACYQGQGVGYFYDLECITMFADYRVPQVLIHFGTLEYSPELIEALSADEVMHNGDRMEVEIRGASIYIVEQVKESVLQELDEKYPQISKANVNSILIDHFLWDYRRQHADELQYIPFHKVLSIYY